MPTWHSAKHMLCVASRKHFQLCAHCEPSQTSAAISQDAPNQQTVCCAEISGEESEGSVMKLEVPDLAEDAAHICYSPQDEQASTAASCRQPDSHAQPLADISNRSAHAVTAIGKPLHHSSPLPHNCLAPGASLKNI